MKKPLIQEKQTEDALAEKHIREMARDICRVKLNCNDVCNPIKTCQALKYAERAYNEGYRKQSEVIKEIIDILEHRSAQNKGRRKGVQSEFWIGVFEGREEAYKDIKEIIERYCRT